MNRLVRERKTIELMIEIYCSDKHATKRGLCEDCNILLQYANQKLDKCLYGETKTTCAKCPIHCYKPKMRQTVREVMRYSGPKMAYKHPILAFRHLLDGRNKAKRAKRNLIQD
ncbi:MAG: nitrous oxide-stimulated promoter family protein [Candidatus Hodarchaeales archaeon]|jgi:hypothetical protein